MNTTSLNRSRRASARALLISAAVAVGVAALAGPASADFTLNTGTLKLENGGNRGSPPTTGSWVRLPTDDPLARPNFFTNTTSTATTTEYTLINGSTANTSLRFGAAQPTGGIIGPLTTFNGAPFSAVTVSAPTLRFAGNHSDAGTRTLVSGELDGLRITYNGGTYDVSTNTSAGGTRTVPLHGTITGSTTSGSARITLDWTTDLDEPGFSPYRAQFHWAGVYLTS
jgi:hypothetical protein